MELGNQLKRNAVLGLIPVTILSHVIIYVLCQWECYNGLIFLFWKESAFLLGLQNVLNFLQPYLYHSVT